MFHLPTNYYCSYGIQYNGKVRVYTLDDLNTTEGQDALINRCDKYYPTLASTWAAHGKGLADVTDAAALREAKLAYITNTLQRGSMVYITKSFPKASSSPRPS